MTIPNKRLAAIVFTVVGLLLIPFGAMQFTSEVNWTLFDLVLAGGLLLGTGLLIELVLRRVRSTRQRLIVCGAILFALLLIWIELAVGLFGTPLAGQ